MQSTFHMLENGIPIASPLTYVNEEEDYRSMEILFNFGTLSETAQSKGMAKILLHAILDAKVGDEGITICQQLTREQFYYDVQVNEEDARIILRGDHVGLLVFSDLIAKAMISDDILDEALLRMFENDVYLFNVQDVEGHPLIHNLHLDNCFPQQSKDHISLGNNGTNFQLSFDEAKDFKNKFLIARNIGIAIDYAISPEIADLYFEDTLTVMRDGPDGPDIALRLKYDAKSYYHEDGHLDYAITFPGVKADTGQSVAADLLAHYLSDLGFNSGQSDDASLELDTEFLSVSHKEMGYNAFFTATGRLPTISSASLINYIATEFNKAAKYVLPERSLQDLKNDYLADIEAKYHGAGHPAMLALAVIRGQEEPKDLELLRSEVEGVSSYDICEVARRVFSNDCCFTCVGDDFFIPSKEIIACRIQQDFNMG
jgi:hypothetical protein